MKNIPRKNYIYVLVLVICTVILTLIICNIYTNKKKDESEFYKGVNSITSDEFKDFVTEKSDLIIYIYDKNSDKYELVEKRLLNLLSEKNLNDRFAYLDKSYLTDDFIDYLNKNYSIDLVYDDKPIILVILENNVLNVISLEEDTDINNVIDFGVFE